MKMLFLLGTVLGPPALVAYVILDKVSLFTVDGWAVLTALLTIAWFMVITLAMRVAGA